ncbi:MAG: hypothetical protein J3K34DRAFT_522852, partial [Monoraphidium minutum]
LQLYVCIATQQRSRSEGQWRGRRSSARPTRFVEARWDKQRCVIRLDAGAGTLGPPIEHDDAPCAAAPPPPLRPARRAPPQAFVGALAANLEAGDRNAEGAVLRLRSARAALEDACDALEHRLIVTAPEDAPSAGGAPAPAAAEAAAEVEAFRARLLQH